MKNYIIIFLLIIIVSSCGNNRPPRGILGEDKMVELLIDIHIAEGMVASFPIAYDSSRNLYPYMEREVFEKHEISDSLFLKSLQYYMLDPKKMDRLYARTIDSLNMYEKVGEQ